MASNTITVSEKVMGLVLQGQEVKLQQSVLDDESSSVGDDCPNMLPKKKTKKKKKKKKLELGKIPVMPTQKLVEKFFPWTAISRTNVGRCAVSSRPIKAGEVVVAERAVAFIARSQDRKAVCHVCCCDIPHDGKFFECSGCKHAVYCQECRDKAVPSHQSWCPVSRAIPDFAKSADCDEDLLRFVLALALQLSPAASSLELRNSDSAFSKEGVVGEGIVTSGIVYPSYQDAMCLVTHIDKALPAWKNSVRKGCELLYNAAMKDESNTSQASHGLRFSVEDLENLAALLNTNAHGMGIHGIHNSDVALGVFPFVSLFNHSCRPNCCFASESNVMYVRATQDVPKGTELCVSYINLYESRSTRKMQLAVTKHFQCCCQRCSEPFTTSVDRFLEGCLCAGRGCSGVVCKSSSLHEKSSAKISSPSTWECDQCSRVLDPAEQTTVALSNVQLWEPWSLVSKAEERLANAMAVYKERRFKEARGLLQQYLDDFTGKLHPLNVLLFDALTPLMNCCRAGGDASEGVQVCRTIVNCMEKVTPGYSLELANFYFCLGEMYSERSSAASTHVIVKHNQKLAQQAFQHVRTIREICLGKPSLPS